MLRDSPWGNLPPSSPNAVDCPVGQRDSPTGPGYYCLDNTVWIQFYPGAPGSIRTFACIIGAYMSDGDSHLDDVRLDQSNRIVRRVAHGAYRILHAHRVVGDEVWGIFGMLSGGYRLLTEIEQDWPVPYQQRICLDVDSRWQPRTLWVQLDAEGERHNAKFTVAGNMVSIDIQQAALQAEDQPARTPAVSRSRVQVGLQAAGSNTTRGAAQPARIVLERATIREDEEITSPFEGSRIQASTASRRTTSRTRLPFGAATHLDFASALSNFIVLQRADLPPGGSIRLDAIVPALPGLAPLRIEQTYTCEGQEPLPGDATKPLTRRYQITESQQANAPAVSTTPITFWADSHGIVLAQELAINGEPHGCEMVRYTWLE